ncbi:thiamine-binding protein [Salsipaludibacter albus]|uniref:thiamine-binding protein n=1 Tax=Salsipaludibacter albus TaxID=2849650 RepID=UPI001EE40F44|nr:thiamine-binding protein [Salsipaludibacter albus]MBY5163521.1 thiamine-binding protein [Salsipaludibacter albus]
MIVAFSISPGGAGESVGDVVGECVEIVRASGLPSETNAMFTNVEGDYDEVMAVIGQCIEHVASVAPRVGVVVKIDHRPGMDDALGHKNARIAGFGDGRGGG